MDKNKKIILISVIIIIILLIIGGIVWYFIANNRENSSNDTENSSISKLYGKLQENSAFSFESKLDDENHMYYAKFNDMAYLDITYNGKDNKYVMKNGNTYLLVDETKTYYTYANNQTNLNMVVTNIENIMNLEHQAGKEKINSENYIYEEYPELTDFAIGNFTGNSEEVKTRFYFDNDELVYIKTIEDDKQELLKVNISYDVDENLFQIPSDYKEA